MKRFNPFSFSAWVGLGACLTLGACGLLVGNGLLSWSVQLPGPVTAVPTVAGGSVFVSAGKGLYCLDGAQGSMLWSHADVPGGFGGTPIVMGNRVLAWAGRLMVLDRNNGQEAWTEAIPNVFAASGGLVALKTATGFKMKDLDRGQDLWSGDPGTGKTVTGMTFDRDRLLVLYSRSVTDGATLPAGLQAWDPSAQSLLWDKDLPTPPLYPPVVGEDRIFLVLPSLAHDEILGLDRKTGGTLWTVKTEPFKTGGSATIPYVSPLASDGTGLLFSARDGSGHTLQCLLPDTGQRLWRFTIDWPVYQVGATEPNLSGPVLGRQSVLLGAGNRLARVDRESGKLRSVYEADSFLRSGPALGEDGTAYFGTVSGRFYATK